MEECASYLGERTGDGAALARSADARHFKGFTQALIAIIKDRKELVLTSIPELFGAQGQRGHPRPFFNRRLAVAIKLLSLVGFIRVAKNARRQRVVTYVSSQNVRNSIYSFLQNAHYTARADKKELKDKLALIRLKQEAARFVDKGTIFKQNGSLFKSRTASFDLGAIDHFLKVNNNIVVPNTHLVLRPETLGGDSARN